jgi:hypothetical protein
MEKAIEILRHIERLYAVNPDLDGFEDMVLRNPDRVAMWEETFRSYELSDVLQAIKEFWRYKNDKVRPRVEQIEAMLSCKSDVKPITNVEHHEKMTDYASMFMARDIELGINRHLMNVYTRAVRYISEDMLLEQISYQEWQQLGLDGRCSRAMQLGLFNELENVLVMICRKLYGKDYQYDSRNMIDASDVPFDHKKVMAELSNRWKIN